MSRTGPGPWRREMSEAFRSLQDELNRLFEDYRTVPPGGPTRGPARGTGHPRPEDLAMEGWRPAVDVAETPDAYLVAVELPGVDPGTIELSLTGDILTIRGQKPADDPEPTGPIRERFHGPFHRQIHLQGAVDFEQAHAEARHGVLRVRLPKREPARPRTIPVQPR